MQEISYRDLVIVKGCERIRDGKMCEARIAGYDEYNRKYSVRLKDGTIVTAVDSASLKLHPITFPGLMYSRRVQYWATKCVTGRQHGSLPRHNAS